MKGKSGQEPEKVLCPPSLSSAPFACFSSSSSLLFLLPSNPDGLHHMWCRPSGFDGRRKRREEEEEKQAKGAEEREGGQRTFSGSCPLFPFINRKGDKIYGRLRT